MVHAAVTCKLYAMEHGTMVPGIPGEPGKPGYTKVCSVGVNGKTRHTSCTPLSILLVRVVPFFTYSAWRIPLARARARETRFSPGDLYNTGTRYPGTCVLE